MYFICIKIRHANHSNEWILDKPWWKLIARSGIRTHAHRSGLRPERSALAHSAVMTVGNSNHIKNYFNSNKLL